MNARIEKKLSKKIVKLLPHRYRLAYCSWWVSDLAYEECVNIMNVPVLDTQLSDEEGWGWEATWQDFRHSYMWICNYPVYEEDHPLAGHPDTGNFKPTTQNLLNLARITIEG